MPNELTYDSGFHWDDPSLRWDEPAPGPAPLVMKKIKLNLSALSDLQLAAFADAIVTSMTANANFTTPDPALATLTGDANAIRNKITQIADLDAQHDVAAGQLTALLQATRNDVRMMGDYVQDKSDGNPDKIRSAGFDVQGEPELLGDLAGVENLRVAFSNVEGQLNSRWNKVRGASSYIVEHALNPSGPWTPAAVTTRVSHKITGLTPGQKDYVRLCAVGAAGPGPWSDLACKMAA